MLFIFCNCTDLGFSKVLSGYPTGNQMLSDNLYQQMSYLLVTRRRVTLMLLRCITAKVGKSLSPYINDNILETVFVFP